MISDHWTSCPGHVCVMLVFRIAMRTPVQQQVAYMVSRSLPMLVSDVTYVDNPQHRQQLAAELAVRINSRETESINAFHAIMHVVHAIRTVHIALHQVIPACDQDLPFQLRLNRRIEPLQTPGRIDVAASLRTPLFATGRAVHLHLESSHTNSETYAISAVIADVLTHGRQTLDTARELLDARHPLLEELMERLLLLLGELKQAVRDRKYLRPAEERRVATRRRQLATRSRSLENARKLRDFFEHGNAHMSKGSYISAQHQISARRLYEFWCFCELTQRLMESDAYRCIQRSLLRTGADSPVFSFGEDHFVFFEHRLSYFRFDADRRVSFREGGGDLIPSWVILRGHTTEDCVVIECKFGAGRTHQLVGPISVLVDDYNSRLGVVFSSQPPPRDLRRQRHHIKDCYLREDFGGARPKSKPLIIAHLCPDAESERRNSCILDHLVGRIGLKPTSALQ